MRLEHALIMARGPAILPEHLPPSVAAAGAGWIRTGDVDHAVALAVRQWSERSLGDTSLNGRVYDELLEYDRAAAIGHGPASATAASVRPPLGRSASTARRCARSSRSTAWVTMWTG